MIRSVRPYRRIRFGVGARLALTLAVVALVSGVGTAGLLYLQDRRDIEAGIVEELLGIASTAALGVNGDLHAEAMESSDPSVTRPFEEIRSWLRRVKIANNLSTDIYTVVENRDHALVFGVMTNERPFSGNPYPSWARTDLIREVLATGAARGSGVYRDENGTWLSAYAPILDGRRRVRAVVEVDRRVDDYLDRLSRRAELTIAVAASAALLAALLGLVFARRISHPLRALSGAVEEMAAGNSVKAPVIRRRDEIGRLARGFAVLVRNLRKRDEEVERLTLGLIAALERASSEDDGDTGLHILRVAACARVIAEAAGLEPALVQKIERFAPLHDVGKVGVPDEILKKTGRLTEEETRIMRRHVRIGSDILGAAGIDAVALNICRYHHERWDGGGYLDGLAGEAIPVEARIVAIADVYDALTNARPYKRAIAHAESLRIMRDESDGHFDPRLLELFLRHADMIESIRLALTRESPPSSRS